MLREAQRLKEEEAAAAIARRQRAKVRMPVVSACHAPTCSAAHRHPCRAATSRSCCALRPAVAVMRQAQQQPQQRGRAAPCCGVLWSVCCAVLRAARRAHG
jgi:hypothetical protein